MKYEYYMHRSGGLAFDHFGGIGRPFPVRRWWACLMKFLGYSVTHCPVGSDTKRIYIRAALLQGAHRRSSKVAELRAGNFNP